MTQAMDNAIAALVISALRALFLAGIAGLGITVSGTKAPSVRLFVWRAVLLSALAMPFLGQVLPPLRIPTPTFFRSANVRPARQAIQASSSLPSTPSHPQANRTESHSSAALPASVVTLTPAPQPRSTSGLHFAWPAIPWHSLPAAIYPLVTSIFLIRLILGFALTQRLIRVSRNIADPRLRQMLSTHAKGSSWSQIRESDLISVPVTVGAFRPAILLPLCWREWDDSQLNAVIAHERSHVSRHDALVQFVSLLHRAIFWFSPLAWWLDRHLVALAEEASDEAALSGGADRNDYAKTLLGFFQALQTAPGRVWWQGVSMAQHGQAEQRLEKILAWRGSITMKKSLVVAIAVFSIPAVYLVASVRPVSQGQTAASTPQSQAPATVPDMASAPVGGPTGGPTGGPAGIGPAAPPMPAAPSNGIYTTGPAPVAPVAPVAAVSSYASQSSEGGYSFTLHYDDEDRFIIVSGKSDSYTMSGSTQDIHHVEKLKKQIPGDFIWFQRDEKSYIIRDQATIARAKTFWAPQEELGKKQEELGKQQEALGKQQEELGKKMEQVRVNVPADMIATLDALKSKLQKLGPSATMDQIGDLQSEIGDLQSKIGEIQGQAGEKQGQLGEEQGKLGELQGKLGEQQGELGRRQGELAREATLKMKALLDEAMKNGKAQPEPDSSHGASL